MPQEVKIWKCKKCSHVWANRTKKDGKNSKPRVCPACKKYTWDD